MSQLQSSEIDLSFFLYSEEAESESFDFVRP